MPRILKSILTLGAVFVLLSMASGAFAQGGRFQLNPPETKTVTLNKVVVYKVVDEKILIVKTADGKFEKHALPSGAIKHNGKQVALAELKPGQQLGTVEMAAFASETFTQTQADGYTITSDTTVSSVMEVATPPVSAASTRAALPATASPVPFIGLTGSALLAIGLGMRSIRRRRPGS